MIRGFVTKIGIAVLEIDEALPRSKVGMMPESHERWLGLIHGAISDLAKKDKVPKFEKAMVGIYITTAVCGKKSQLWDTSNRAINLVINNLKGVFFPDDNIEHMAFSVVGDVGATAMTRIYIGDFRTQSAQIMELLVVGKTEE